MEISAFKKLNYILLLIFSLLFSCKDNSTSIDLLKQSQSLAESDPTAALRLLDSIHNAEDMDMDNYMQYIVTLTDIKHKKQEENTNDTLIFEAKKYFDQKKDLKKLALTHFLIGHLYQRKQMHDEALKSFLQAENYARQTNNNILAGKSIHNIGFLYFERKIMDSAIVRYRQALNYYNKEQNTDQLKGQAMNLIGRTYEAVDNLDSAHFYFDKSLELANKINNKSDQAIATSNLGVILRRKKDYNKAVDYFQKSLATTSEPNDSLNIYLNLLKLYNTKNQFDSATFYADTVKNRLPNIINNYALKHAYHSLANYYKESNQQEFNYYSDLQKEIEHKITEADNSQKLLEIEKKYQMSLREKELESLQIRSYLYMSIGISAAILIVLITWFRNRNNRLKHAQEVEKNKLLEQKLENLLFLQSIYHNIITEWAGIEDEVKSLALDLGVKEEPTIYLRIRKMVENVKGKTNQQLIENAKDFLKKEPFGEQAIELLNEKELLIIMLSYCKYSKKEMSIILGDMAGSKNLHVQKLDIQRKLLNLGMTESRTNEILFAKNNDQK